LAPPDEEEPTDLEAQAKRERQKQEEELRNRESISALELRYLNAQITPELQHERFSSTSHISTHVDKMLKQKKEKIRSIFESSKSVN